MIELTKEQASIEQDQGAGIVSFMGGFESTNGKLILIVEDRLYLFNEDEIKNSDDYERIWQLQCEEGKRFIEQYEHERNG